MPTDLNVGGEVIEGQQPVEPKSPEAPETPQAPEIPETPETPETPEQPTPPAEPTPFQLNKADWDQYQADLREIKTWRAEQDRIRAEQQQREQNNPARAEWTPEQWSMAEKDFGFSISKQADADGKEHEVLHIDRRQMIQGIMKAINYGLQMQDQAWEKKLNTHTSASRVETSVFDLEHRKENPLADIRQHLPAMREYLAKRIDPKFHADKEVLEDAYLWAKGRSASSIAARAAAGAREKGGVIHPSAPKAPAKPGNGNLTPLERELMAGIPEKDWLAAKNGR